MLNFLVKLTDFDRKFLIVIAFIRAHFYVLFHWFTHLQVESIFEEIIDSTYSGKPYFKEKITFVGVSTGSYRNNSLRIVKAYYGNPRA